MSSVPQMNGALCEEPVSASPTKNADPILIKPKPLRPVLFPLHPILCHTTSHTSSLRSVSRRSSSSGSTTSLSSATTNKSVHFPGSPTKMSTFHLTHSRDQYDRSPIIPSYEDLEIPSCKNASTGGWIQCLQKRAKEAVAKGIPPPYISSVFSGDLNFPSVLEGTLASPTTSFSNESPPSLANDDLSSCDSEGTHSPPRTRPSLIDSDSAAAEFSSALLRQSLMSDVRDFRWDSLHQSTTVAFIEDQYDGEMEDETSENEEDGGSDAEEDAPRKSSGMCGLGKFSRSSLYREDDALSGF